MPPAWSPHGRLVVASWSPRGRLMVASCPPHGRRMVTSWSPRGHPECLSVVIYHRFDPYKPVVCASLGHIYGDPPPPLIGFFEACAGPIWGDSGEVTRIYTSRDILPQNSPEFTPSSPAVHRGLCRWQGSEESNPELRFWRPLCCHYTRP